MLCVEPVSVEEEAFGAIGSIDYWIKEKKINEDLMVIASDNYFEFDLAKFVAAYDHRHTLVAVYDIGDKSRARQYGVVSLRGNRIVRLREKPEEPESSLVAIACYIFPPRIFPLLFQCCTGSRDHLGNFISYLTETDEVSAYTFCETWFDIGSPEVYKSLK
jgi:glucose-1-phosphate thymidylyltransferase